MQHLSPLAGHTAGAFRVTVVGYCVTLLGLLLSWTAAAQSPAWAAVAHGSNLPTSLTSQVLATAVDGAGNVFVTGYFTGTLTLGSTMLTSAGSSDLFVAKYVPRTATWAWAQSGGGTEGDWASGIAVSGTSVYVAGTIFNNTADVSAVRFGGTGTTPGTVQQNGATAIRSTDLVVAKYTDNGGSATLGWTQVGGGTGLEQSFGIAASGTSVYVTGTIYNNMADVTAVRFGGSGTTPGTVQQNGASTTASLDLVVAKYTDNGSSATLGWTQVGGGTGADLGQGIAVSGQNVLVGGFVTPSASFGTATIATPSGSNTGVLARLVDPSLPLAVVPEGATARLALYPNPGYGGDATTLMGAGPGTVVRVLDALGRPVAQATAAATGTAVLVLPQGLAHGVYVVRADTRVLRLTVE